MEDTIGRFLIAIVYLIIGIPFAVYFNNKFNPKNHIGFRYGYFLSVCTILNNIIYVIILYNIFFDKRYIYASDVFSFLLICLPITAFHIFIAVLNGKKYKIGAVLASIFTGHLIICLFYYKTRWHELKKIQNIKDILSINTFDFNNLNIKEILQEFNLEEYIDIFEKNKLNDINIIINLTENDYEKIGINILGDRKRLVNIFSKKELAKYAKSYSNNKIESKNEELKYKENLDNISYKNDNSLLENQIKIIRLNSVVGSALTIDVRVDNKNYQLENGEEIIINIENGKHEISTSFNNDFEKIEFEINNNNKTFSIIIKPPIKLEEI